MLRPPIECSTCPLGPVPGRACAFTPTRVAAGELVYAQGQAWDRAGFLREGLLALSSVTADGAALRRGGVERHDFGYRSPRAHRRPPLRGHLPAVRRLAWHRAEPGPR